MYELKWTDMDLHTAKYRQSSFQSFFFKLIHHCTIFILIVFLYRTHSKKKTCQILPSLNVKRNSLLLWHPWPSSPMSSSAIPWAPSLGHYSNFEHRPQWLYHHRHSASGTVQCRPGSCACTGSKWAWQSRRGAQIRTALLGPCSWPLQSRDCSWPTHDFGIKIYTKLEEISLKRRCATTVFKMVSFFFLQLLYF